MLRDVAGSSRRSTILGPAPAVRVAEDARERHAGQAAELRDRPAVDGVGRRVESDVGQIRAGRKVRLLDAVDDRAAFERDAPANGVDARIRGGEPRRDVELQDDAVAGPPAPCQRGVLARRDRLAVDDRGPGPRRDPERQRPLGIGARDDVDRDRARPRIARLDGELDRAGGGHGGADRRRRVLMQLDARLRHGGEVVVQRRQEPHDVRRAARDGVPAVTSLAVPRLQGVHVEERLAVERKPREEAVVERSLEEVGEAALARDEQHAPVPHDAADRRAGLAVGAVGRQLVGIADRLAVVTRADPAGQVGLRRGQVVPLAGASTRAAPRLPSRRRCR